MDRWQAQRGHPEKRGGYAATVKITDAGAAPAAQSLRVAVDVQCVSGVIGVGLLDLDKDVWLHELQRPAGTHETVVLEAQWSGQPVNFVIMHGGGPDGRPATASVGDVRAELGGQAVPIDWATLSIHNSADIIDDGTNPLGREARFGCKAVYYNLYINELFYRMNPCCYMQNVPGYDEVRFDGDVDFMEAWNSPGMVALRQHLRDGPLFGACMRCPEKW